jgi:negative regulator of flagellin synthesis FlgM
MSSIDRITAQDAARTYVQNTDVTRSGGVPQAAKAQSDQQPIRSVDSITLSDSARSLAAARDAVRNAPDVREEKVAAIRDLVSQGTYSVPASELAQNMLSSYQA